MILPGWRYCPVMGRPVTARRHLPASSIDGCADVIDHPALLVQEDPAPAPGLCRHFIPTEPMADGTHRCGFCHP